MIKKQKQGKKEFAVGRLLNGNERRRNTCFCACNPKGGTRKETLLFFSIQPARDAQATTMGKASLKKAKKIKNVALKRTRAVCASPTLLCAHRVVLTARARSAYSRTWRRKAPAHETAPRRRKAAGLRSAGRNRASAGLRAGIVVPAQRVSADPAAWGSSQAGNLLAWLVRRRISGWTAGSQAREGCPEQPAAASPRRATRARPIRRAASRTVCSHPALQSAAAVPRARSDSRSMASSTRECLQSFLGGMVLENG
jgi:hypothetical protein